MLIFHSINFLLNAIYNVLAYQYILRIETGVLLAYDVGILGGISGAARIFRKGGGYRTISPTSNNPDIEAKKDVTYYSSSFG